MANKWFQAYQELPPWGKGAVALGVIAAGVAGYYALRNLAKDIKRKKELAEKNKAAKLAEEELASLSQKGIVPTLSNSEFENMAQSLAEAMNDCGTDEDRIYDVFRRLKNDADIRKLVSAFGIRYYRPCAADQPIAAIRYQFDDKAYGGPLGEWLTYDLNASEIKKVNDILKSNRINYAF